VKQGGLVTLAMAMAIAGWACGGSGGHAVEPRAILVAPAPLASNAAPPPEAPPASGEEIAPFEIALEGQQICARVAGHIHCLSDDGPADALTSATPLEGIEDAISFALGQGFGCAATRAGAVLCFGDNSFGQLGAKLRATRSDKPVAVAGITTAKRVVAGQGHACALLRDGTVRCWGRNEAGQTGGTTSYVAAAHELIEPDTVPGLKDVVSIAAGASATCATTRSQEVTCWGRVMLEGDDPTAWSQKNIRPTAMADLTRVDELTALDGAFCGIIGGEVRCWGETWSLTPSGRAGSSKRMMDVGISRARKVRLGASHGCALLFDGSVSCWGANYAGALGRGETEGYEALEPEVVKGVPFAVDVMVGGSMSCAVTGAREVYCWGSWPHRMQHPRKETGPVKVRITG